MEKVVFVPTGMACNGRSRVFCPYLNGLEWRKLVLARLEWLEMEEVGFGPKIAQIPNFRT
jgi:hypothetical protein